MVRNRTYSGGWTDGFDCWECGHHSCWEDGWSHPTLEDTLICDDCAKLPHIKAQYPTPPCSCDRSPSPPKRTLWERLRATISQKWLG